MVTFKSLLRFDNYTKYLKKKPGFRLSLFSDYQLNFPYKLIALAFVLVTRILKVFRKQTSKQILQQKTTTTVYLFKEI